jgi:antitoxin component YwqK of YwqJK toxin-antitoxin module
MELKAHSHFNILGVFLIPLLFFACNNSPKKEPKKSTEQVSLLVDTSMIPNDTVKVSNKNLVLDNGVYLLNKVAFTGYIEELHENSSKTKSVGSYLNGKQEGETKTYFLDGSLRDNRSYKEGRAYGRHIGNWENGNPKFDFVYINDKREGLQKQWYESGAKYAFLTFKDDTEDGMQKAWRENGKPYINYEARNGFRYGLQKAALCYTLRDGKLKTEQK